MKKISANELRELYQSFFESKGHKRIASASLIPENDPTVLFTTAGMHPLVPYLLGESHPAGKRLTDVQKCIRTGDIDDVGDNSHLTFFEMLGNWSLGDYFKKEAIAMSFEFLTSEEYLAIPKEKLYFSCFAGDETAPKDEESYNAWLEAGVDPSHIFFLPKENNFWILGSGVGPCGPDTEMFYDTGKEKCCDECNPACSCGKYLEIWNDVFMEFYKGEDGKLTKLAHHNVDTGMGLERVICVLNGLESVYESELFAGTRAKLEALSGKRYEDNKKSFRIIMDHVRTATFILGDDHGIVPSNVGAGYVLRRILRRMIREMKKLEITASLCELAKIVISDYSKVYPELKRNENFILDEIAKEENKFSKTLKDGERLFYKTIKHLEGKVISGTDAFKLFDTFGFPLEMTLELAKENDLSVDEKGFYEKFKEHQDKSRTLDAGVFKGGLADQSYETTKYHTLAHLMLASLREMFGSEIYQKGSNITSERLRFDFNLDHKMTDEEKATLTNRVNEMIRSNTEVVCENMTYEEAKKAGALGSFENKYGEVVKVYTIGNLSKEICGGPHVKNTSELGEFVIQKEESSSAGVRRIKAVLK
ncbi:MAG: alanine--tRNA ligase [Firmicutes bacterium]|nr:alanine--tRNA ligase [Bacillota bacterium]